MPEAPIVIPEPEVIPDLDPFTEPDTDDEVKLQPPYGVILHNDPVNGMDYVVGVLKKIFRYSTVKAIALMLQCHFTGRSLIFSGSFEVAEFKADQVRSCGPDPAKKHQGATVLSVSVEPLG